MSTLKSLLMPTYEYHCHKCGQNFDVEQRMTDDALVSHPECGGEVVKVFSSAGIVLKGSGFYKTDARAKSTTTAKPKKDSSSSDSSTPKTPEKPSTPPAKSDSPAKATTPKPSNSQ